ncbi:RNA polymerase sigma factor (sigma-70 family) [Microbacterium natoriense]|uniref:RNA polymerase sigma factor (Sigma-70 family) n=1 Tax=Microbacterium natoriense TaxID=284570 RepID=A0AAW8F280_9MICO|nr:RNA polymerase sigma factor (sigma-70 family) [Microbacterium natoriense]
MGGSIRVEDPRSDAELLRELRDGQREAYVILWERHIGAALRYSRRLLPSRAEDLASESFLAIYQQVTTNGGGPDFAFRSYLKAVIRNTAIRWRKEASRFDDTVEADTVDFRDALSLVERESNANELLGAFQDLPERWQKVLWLSEVADVARPQIARELGIKPNAVSALHRRARTGLKVQWLTRQVPAPLRDDESHAARLLPRYLSVPDDPDVSVEVTTHLENCMMCSDLLVVLRTDARRLQGVTLSAVGFGALGVALPATSALAPGTAVAAGALLTGAGAGIASLLAGGVGVLAVGGILLGSFLVHPGEADGAPLTDARSSVATASPAPGGPSTGQTGATSPPSTTAPAQPDPPRLGRWNSDPGIESVDLVDDPDAFPGYPTRPQPATQPVADPGDDPDAPLTPGVTTPAASAGYIAPAIAGTATPGSAVAVELNGRRYTPAVGDDGSWSFDPRGLELPAGTYDYQVWADDGTTQSTATIGSFTIESPAVKGFEDITGNWDMQVTEASTTGLVIDVTGPANGTISVSSMTGHTAVITLDSAGHAVKRLRMNSRGWYWFYFRALDADGYWGPAYEHPLDVYDPEIIFDPWGPSPEEMIFEFVDP